MALMLSLLRHAKSSRDDITLADIDRPLAERGRRDAPRMGAWMAAQNLVPDYIACSTSVRTRETLALVLPHLGKVRPPAFMKAMYHAEVETLQKLVRALPAEAKHALLVGHNPGFHELAILLGEKGPREMRASLHEKFPSGSCATITFECDRWSDISRSDGTLTHWMSPKSLG